MFQNLSVFRTAHALAVHAGKRQALLAQNIANVDTPGYRPRDLAAFSMTPLGQANATMKATRTGHHDHATGLPKGTARAVKTELAPNGNGVSIEAEMLKAVDVQRQHERALAIYKSSLNILRTSLRSR